MIARREQARFASSSAKRDSRDRNSASSSAKRDRRNQFLDRDQRQRLEQSFHKAQSAAAAERAARQMHLIDGDRDLADAALERAKAHDEDARAVMTILDRFPLRRLPRR